MTFDLHLSQFLLSLPYCEELRAAFCATAFFHLSRDNDAPRALEWIRALELDVRRGGRPGRREAVRRNLAVETPVRELHLVP